MVTSAIEFGLDGPVGDGAAPVTKSMPTFADRDTTMMWATSRNCQTYLIRLMPTLRR
jgi:hypothetical protein